MNAQGCGSITCSATNSLATPEVINSRLGDGFLCKQTLVVQEASWAVLRLPKFFIPNGKMNTKLRFWSLTVLERVTAAETAIFNRIQAISPEHIAERQAIEDALANLRTIRRENLGLPVKQR